MREDALTVPDLYSNVRVLSRHALEVEQSLHKGTVKERSLNHLVQPKKQGTVYNYEDDVNCGNTTFKRAVSRQSSSFCLILPITHPQSLWNLK